jgi:hypothetical protein
MIRDDHAGLIGVIYRSHASSATADHLKRLDQRMAQAGAALDKSVIVLRQVSISRYRLSRHEYATDRTGRVRPAFLFERSSPMMLTTVRAKPAVPWQTVFSSSASTTILSMTG